MDAEEALERNFEIFMDEVEAHADPAFGDGKMPRINQAARELLDALEAEFVHEGDCNTEDMDREAKVMEAARGVDGPGGELAEGTPGPDEVTAREFLMPTPRPEAASRLMTECFLTMLSLYGESKADPNPEIRTAARALWQALGASHPDTWRGPALTA
jgi:hypothetical protein